MISNNFLFLRDNFPLKIRNEINESNIINIFDSFAKNSICYFCSKPSITIQKFIYSNKVLFYCANCLSPNIDISFNINEGYLNIIYVMFSEYINSNKNTINNDLFLHYYSYLLMADEVNLKNNKTKLLISNSFIFESIFSYTFDKSIWDVNEDDLNKIHNLIVFV